MTKTSTRIKGLIDDFEAAVRDHEVKGCLDPVTHVHVNQAYDRTRKKLEEYMRARAFNSKTKE